MTMLSRDTLRAGLQAVDLHLQRGDVRLRRSEDGSDGYFEAAIPVEVDSDGSTLSVRQSDFGSADFEAALPDSLRRVLCHTGLGDLRLDRTAAEVEARTGKGDVTLVGGRGRVAVETGKGDVRVDGWDGDLRLRTGHGNVEVEATGGALEANTGKGDVRIEGPFARTRVTTGKGNVVAARLGGEASLHSGHGDVVATELSGASLEVQTGKGGIVLDGRLGGLRASTGHGDVVCRCALSAGSFEVNSSHGDITVHLPDEAAVRVEVVTGHGRVETNLPLVRVGRPGPAGQFGQRFVGSIGAEPRATLRLQTSRGDVKVLRASGEAVELGEFGEAEGEPQEPLAGTATERAWRETMRTFEERLRRDAESFGERVERDVRGSLPSSLADLGRDVADFGEHIAQAVRESVEASFEAARVEGRRWDVAEGVREADEAAREAEDEAREAEAEAREAEAEAREAEEEARRSSAEDAEAAVEEARAAAEVAREAQEEARRTAAAAAEARARATSLHEAPSAPTSDPELAVLEAVSRGEMSVDDALAALGRLAEERKRSSEG